MKRRKGHIKLIILLLLSVEILAVVGLLAYIQTRPMVVEAVTLEAGTGTLKVEEFLMYKNRKGSFITNVGKIPLDQPGTYEIQIKIGKKIHTSSLQVVDTIAPTATANNLMVLKNEAVEADAFISDIVDATKVTASYLEKPDTSVPGDKDVTIILEDKGNNCTKLKAKLTVLDIKNEVTVEAGAPMNISASDYVNNDKYDVSFITDLSKLDTSKPTVHKIELNVNGRTVTGNIKVVDTTSPKASFTNQETWQNEAVEANAFVSNIVDVSGVTIAYKTEPDFAKVGDQQVMIELKDDYGNMTEQQVKLTVLADTIPPQILGTRNKTVYIGEGVAYRKGVSVTDNKDQGLKLSVDSSAVNLKKVGVYNVIYTAEDLSGNKATVTVTVTVIKFAVTEDAVYDKADEILSDIITSSMTKLEKAEAIYHWIKAHVGYTGDSDKSDWLAEAYRAMTKGEGDCFTFYAVAQALLTRAGIDNMQVTRLGGKTHHYWNLVNCGDGWYYFDSCPNKDHVETFMLTDKELDEFAKTRGSYYYNRDKSLYPATP
ncbi:MAG TPA: transglutaminase-like domain-containing protein [Mobilitalea sp.]|nr:transglutaminase-like domain-containing protein [Mobilitalea sp.]